MKLLNQEEIIIEHRDVGALHEKIFGKKIDLTPYSKQGMLTIRAEEKGKKIMAAYMLYAFAGEVVDLHFIAVNPEYRREGLAKNLMESFLAHAKLKGATEATLEVRSDNELAIYLYKSCGFENVGTRKKYYEDGCDSILMSRAIDLKKKDLECVDATSYELDLDIDIIS